MEISENKTNTIISTITKYKWPLGIAICILSGLVGYKLADTFLKKKQKNDTQLDPITHRPPV